MMNLLLVVAGGAVGAGLRHLTSVAVTRRIGGDWPYATFSVNVVGSLLIGVLAGWLVARGEEGSSPLRLLIGTGLLGGFTTFSAFSLETAMLIERGRVGSAAVYALGSVAVGLVFVFVGLFIARRLFG